MVNAVSAVLWGRESAQEKGRGLLVCAKTQCTMGYLPAHDQDFIGSTFPLCFFPFRILFFLMCKSMWVFCLHKWTTSVPRLQDGPHTQAALSRHEDDKASKVKGSRGCTPRKRWSPHLTQGYKFPNHYCVCRQHCLRLMIVKFTDAYSKVMTQSTQRPVCICIYIHIFW